jgi:hypothetical protein
MSDNPYILIGHWQDVAFNFPRRAARGGRLKQLHIQQGDSKVCLPVHSRIPVHFRYTPGPKAINQYRELSGLGLSSNMQHREKSALANITNSICQGATLSATQKHLPVPIEDAETRSKC